MKRWFALVLTAILLLSLTACGKTADQSSDTAPSATTKTTAKMARPLPERIVCADCYQEHQPDRAHEMNTQEVADVIGTLTCSICGAVDGETVKFGDTVFVLAE